MFVFCAMTCDCVSVRLRVSLFWPLSLNLTRVSTKQSRAIGDLPVGCSANMCHALFLFQPSNNTSARRSGGYFKIFLTIEAQRAAVMIHGSAFSDDNSATVSSIPSPAAGLVSLKENWQMEHNGQDLGGVVAGGGAASHGASLKDWLGLRAKRDPERIHGAHPVRRPRSWGANCEPFFPSAE